MDNRPGAGGNIGTALAAKARPDGYTLILTVNSTHVINPALYKSTGFDPVKDFEPISLAANAGYVLVANAAFPANSVADLIALAKAKPGVINHASVGNGTLNLDSSVGRARVGRWRRVRVGATTQQATACQAEQRPRARCQWLNRVRSALTQKVNRVEAKKVNVHTDLLVKSSGQLRNLG